MACVHVLVGQCGNQLGASFLDSLVAEARASEDDAFAAQVSSLHFRPSPAASSSSPPLPRCVMIDMEPKVIDALLARADGAAAYRLHARQCITRDEGSANNWAFGCYHQGSSRRGDVVEALRRECESWGTVGAFHVVHSIAGGTGSGVGCLVADAVREEFPRALLLHTVVWPFATGEVVTQWYNCVMAMSALRDAADAVFMAHNDDFGDVAAAVRRANASGLGGGGGCGGGSSFCSSSVGAAEVSFDTINDRISRLLVDLHLPQQLCRVPPLSDQPPRPRTLIGAASKNNIHPHDAAAMPLRCGTISDIVEAVALDPAMKFFSGLAIPTTTVGGSDSNNCNSSNGIDSRSMTWHSVLREAARRSAELFPTSAAGGVRRPYLWSLRGPAVYDEGLAELQHAIASTAATPTNASVCALPTGLVAHERPFRGHDAHVSLFGPSHRIGVRLSAALERAEQLLSVGAFTHHFARYGVAEDDMRDAVVRLWDTAAAYAAA